MPFPVEVIEINDSSDEEHADDKTQIKTTPGQGEVVRRGKNEDVGDDKRNENTSKPLASPMMSDNPTASPSTTEPKGTEISTAKLPATTHDHGATSSVSTCITRAPSTTTSIANNNDSNQKKLHPQHELLTNQAVTAATTNSPSSPARQHRGDTVKVPLQDPLYQKDSILNALEMEVLMLTEECWYCCYNHKTISLLDFLWEYATPQLRMQLRQVSHEDDGDANAHDTHDPSNPIWKKLLPRYAQNRLVQQRWEFVRGSYRNLLRQGYQRPLMAPVLVHLRHCWPRSNPEQRLSFPRPNVTALFTKKDRRKATGVEHTASKPNKTTTPSPPSSSSSQRKTALSHGTGVEMLDADTGTVLRTFASLREAERAMGVDLQQLREAMTSSHHQQQGKEKGSPVMADGYRWRRMREDGTPRLGASGWRHTTALAKTTPSIMHSPSRSPIHNHKKRPRPSPDTTDDEDGEYV